MKNYVHRLSDPRDPAYPFSDTFICSNCNERLSLESTSCDICNLYIYGEVESVKPSNPSTYPEPAPYNKSYIVDKTNSTVKNDDLLNPINPEVDEYIKSLFSQSFVLILMIIIALVAFLFFDYSTITVDYNKQLIGK